MNRLITRALAVGLLLAGAAPDAAAHDYILRARAEAMADVAARHGLTIVRPVDDGGYDVCLVSTSDTRPVAEVNAELRQDPDVVAFERNAPVTIEDARSPLPPRVFQPTLPGPVDSSLVDYFGARVWQGYASQPATARIRLGPTFNKFSPRTAIVAVIDSAIDVTHPAIAGAILPGYDFISHQASQPDVLSPSTVSILDFGGVTDAGDAALNPSTVSILDDEAPALAATAATVGHGTMVAGLIRLVAPHVQILPLRAFRDDGRSSLFDVISAVYYAVDHGAKVINMSFSMATVTPELLRAVNFAWAHGVICVASAGNVGAETLAFPAALRTVLSVAAIDPSGARSVFSNYGESLVSLAAPGEQLIVPFPGNRYAVAWGTSFSAAIVSGATAVLASLDPQIQPDRVADFLTSTAVRSFNVRDGLGGGRLDLFGAITKWDRSR